MSLIPCGRSCGSSASRPAKPSRRVKRSHPSRPDVRLRSFRCTSQSCGINTGLSSSSAMSHSPTFYHRGHLHKADLTLVSRACSLCYTKGLPKVQKVLPCVWLLFQRHALAATGVSPPRIGEGTTHEPANAGPFYHPALLTWSVSLSSRLDVGSSLPDRHEPLHSTARSNRFTAEELHASQGLIKASKCYLVGAPVQRLDHTGVSPHFVKDPLTNRHGLSLLPPHAQP